MRLLLRARRTRSSARTFFPPGSFSPQDFFSPSATLFALFSRPPFSHSFQLTVQVISPPLSIFLPFPFPLPSLHVRQLSLPLILHPFALFSFLSVTLFPRRHALSSHASPPLLGNGCRSPLRHSSFLAVLGAPVFGAIAPPVAPRGEALDNRLPRTSRARFRPRHLCPVAGGWIEP